jgi:hypothetical protein
MPIASRLFGSVVVWLLFPRLRGMIGAMSEPADNPSLGHDEAYQTAKAKAKSLGDQHEAHAAAFLAHLSLEEMRDAIQRTMQNRFDTLDPDFVRACIVVQLHNESMRRIEHERPSDS